MNRLLGVLFLLWGAVTSGMCESSPSPLVHRTASSPKVEIFVTSWCPYCLKLEAYLEAKGVRYTRYDIERDATGRTIHRQLGGGGVPVMRIGSRIVRGFDIKAIDSALEAASESRSAPAGKISLEY